MTIPNFRQVHEWLYRGGQPDSAGFQELKDLGIKTIVSLRKSTEIRSKQRREAESMGFEYVSIPLSYLGFPKQDQIDKFFAIVNSPSRHPVFVHCKHGSDRTGMMMAFFRMTNDGWTVRDAYAEMEAAGFHKMVVYHYKFAVFRYARKMAQLGQR